MKTLIAVIVLTTVLLVCAVALEFSDCWTIGDQYECRYTGF